MQRQGRPPKQPGKPALPALEGIVNRRAQQIIMEHMHRSATQSSMSSTATVPMLMQLESTAPRTARTHDISHLRDQPIALAPKIPPSLIDEKDHVYESSFLPTDSSSIYQEADGLWYTKVFPSSNPSSRVDAVRLDAWITKCLEAYKTNSSKGPAKEDLAKAVEELVPILSTALHEIVRQVTHHCIERGSVLEKIWQTYVNLFNCVLHEMQASLKSEQEKTNSIHEVLMKTRRDLEGLKRSHPEKMQVVISELEEQFTTRQKKVEEELREAEEENHNLKQELRTVHGELELWYPSFPSYQDSYLKNHIPSYSRTHGPAHGHTHDRIHGGSGNDAVSPEVAIAEDFKRLLAILALEKRQAIGKELTYVLKTPTTNKPEKPDGKDKHKHKTRLSQIVAEGQRQAEEEAQVIALQEEVQSQEKQIQDLKELIRTLEREQLAVHQLHVESQNAATAQDGDYDSGHPGHRRGTAMPIDTSAALGARHAPGAKTRKGLMP